MKSSFQASTTTAQPSVDTTYLVQNNSSLELERQLSKSFTELESAVADYSAIVADIKYVYSLKQKLFQQAVDIERVNSENNELVQLISRAVIDRDNNMFYLQIEYVALYEQHYMLARLLTMARKAQQQYEQPEIIHMLSQDFEELIYKPFKGKRMTKAYAVGLMGELDRYKQSNYACYFCCETREQQFDYEYYYAADNTASVEFNMPDPDVVAPASSASNRLLSYYSRIYSLLLETRGLYALLAHRIGELEAGYLRLQGTLSKQENYAAFNLERAEAAKNDIIKKQAYAEARFLRLQSDNAVMAAKGATDSLKTRKTTDYALRSARREVHIFYLNKYREIDRAYQQAKKDAYVAIARYEKRHSALQEHIRERTNWISLLNARISTLEYKLHSEGLANGEMRYILARINGRE